MCLAAELFRSRTYARAMAVMLIGFGTAGCSAEPNGYNDASFQGRSETTGSVRPTSQLAMQSPRPPMAIPEDPVMRPVGARPVVARTRDRSGSGRRFATTSHASPQGAASGQKPIRIASRPAEPPLEVTRPKEVSPLPPAKPAHEQIVVPDAKTQNVPPKTEIALAPRAPAQPAETPVASAPVVDPSNSIGSLKAAEAGSTFHWPVHGQVISGFGSKINGQENKGINVAVPEDTPIKAADDGVVLYTGNGLKSYGNLLLVRHANGYVTVYAHAKELLVKSGDDIKRDQVIAKSGKTGDVDRPQVHFEIRKAAAPVNPMQYLNGA
jgi:murein DD-endopeptidase MepM/ murein hydrolase activator NlpD